MTERVLVVLANGFEEIEAVTIIDILRRAEIDTTVAGLTSRSVIGAHQITLQTDTLFKEVEGNDYQMLVLPGGQPGTQNLSESEPLINLLKEFVQSGRKVAAICAAPMVLAQAGLLDDVEAVCYPGCEGGMGKAIILDQSVAVTPQITTGQGPAAATAFALQLVKGIKGEIVSTQVANDLLYSK
jgi:4-methyl-5(b-hydroxyethyl)-thiazole monophosphate biosynthesis